MNADDKKAFEQAMLGVKRLKQTKIEPKPEPTKPVRKHRKNPTKADETLTEFAFSEYERLLPVGSEESLSYTFPGVGQKILRKLRQGQYNIEAILDLHGNTVAEARNALGRFLSMCEKKNLTCILIIHGKGHQQEKPILKNRLNHWLRETKQVLAFCSARPNDGGKGALYVLLRRSLLD
ncbi:MAG: Smr/MutS family protein [Gammaproteobacteria bacterium]|nr:Smr/MutS family protein [Gammaproteobacteria bacterium]